MATATLPTRSAFIGTLHKNCLVAQKDDSTPTPPEDTCSICLSTYATAWINYHPNGTFSHLTTHLATQVPCGHYFGYCCIKKWLQQSSSQCPMCRTVFFAADEPVVPVVPEASGDVVEVVGWEEISEAGPGIEEESSEWESESEGEGEGEEYADEDLRGDWFGLDVYGPGDEEGEDIGVYATYDRAVTVSISMDGQAVRVEGGKGAGGSTAETTEDTVASPPEASTFKEPKDISAYATYPRAITISISASGDATHEHNAKPTDTPSIPPLHLGDAEPDNHAEDVQTWSMNGGVLLPRYEDDTSSIPRLDLGNTESDSPNELTWSMNGGILLED
jgi:hypothetical protein